MCKFAERLGINLVNPLSLRGALENLTAGDKIRFQQDCAHGRTTEKGRDPAPDGP